ncbi:MAG TPA: hypothetical protein VIY73_05320 [Polyangiaceae bacterium]
MRRTLVLTCVVAALAAAAACKTLTPEPDVSECTALAAECTHCTDPGTRQTCENVVATTDDVQCSVEFDDPQVVAYCSGEGGVEGGPDAVVDAPPLPTCDPSDIALDASDCACAPGETCAPTCDQGHCTVHCPATATCEGSCSGGGCVFECAAGSTCANSCTGGGCAFTCEDQAVCNDTCPLDGGCTGY